MAELVGHLEQQLSTELNHVDAAPCLMGDSVGGLLTLWFAGSAFSQAFPRFICWMPPYYVGLPNTGFPGVVSSSLTR